MRRYTLSMGVLAVVALSATSSEAQICVDPLNAPPCHATIGAAIIAAPAGGTIEIAASVYPEVVVIPNTKTGLSLIGAGAKSTVVEAGPPLSGPGILVQANDVTIEGIGIINSDDFGIEFDSAVSGGTVIKSKVVASADSCIRFNGSGGRVEKSTLIGCGQDGIEGGAMATNLFVIGNTISQTRDGGVDLIASGALIEKNKITLSDDSPGIDVQGDLFVIQKNKFVDCEDGIRVDCTACTSALISSNKILHGAGDSGGIIATSDAAGLVIEKNSVKQVTDSAFLISGAGGIIVRGNKAKFSGGDNNEACFDISGTGHTVEGNSASNCHEDGFTLSGASHTVSGNSASGCIEDGFDIEGNNITLTGNKSSKNVAEGFDVSSGVSGAVLNDNSASGNRVDYCDEGVGTSSMDNSFVTTAPTCDID